MVRSCLGIGIVLFTAVLANATTNLRHVANSQVSLSMKQDPQQEACTCLNWNAVYNESYVPCGGGNEFFFVTKTSQPDFFQLSHIKADQSHSICRSFFKKIQDNACVNINQGEDRGQWCYVKSACYLVNGGAPVAGRTDMNWKKCKEGEDNLLRNLPPDELTSYAQKHDISIDLLAKLSYPTFEGSLWKNIQDSHRFSDEVWAMLESPTPVVVNTHRNKAPPTRIIHGSKVYTVKARKDSKSWHPSTLYEVVDDTEELGDALLESPLDEPQSPKELPTEANGQQWHEVTSPEPSPDVKAPTMPEAQDPKPPSPEQPMPNVVPQAKSQDQSPPSPEQPAPNMLPQDQSPPSPEQPPPNMMPQEPAPDVPVPEAKQVPSAKEDQPPECECQNWKDTYAQMRVMCGATNEYYFSSNTSTPGFFLPKLTQALGHEFCQNFFMKLDDNRCVNIDMGIDRGQWCYVAPQCFRLNGGNNVFGGGANWKVCNPKQDKMLREEKPEELAAMAKQFDLDLGLLHKMSYPLSKKIYWRDVRDYFVVGPEYSSPQLRTVLDKIVNSGQPYSFDTDESKHPPHKIVYGNKVYTVKGSPKRDDFHPGTWNVLEEVNVAAIRPK